MRKDQSGSMKESEVSKGKDGHGDGKEADAEAKAATLDIKTELQGNESSDIKSEQMVQQRRW